MSHHSTQDPDSPDRRCNMDSDKSYFNKYTESVSFDEKIPQLQMEDVPMENYEEVQAPETNPIPKPKPSHAAQNASPVCYTQGENTKSAVAPPVQGQCQPKLPSDPPETVP